MRLHCLRMCLSCMKSCLWSFAAVCLRLEPSKNESTKSALLCTLPLSPTARPCRQVQPASRIYNPCTNRCWIAMHCSRHTHIWPQLPRQWMRCRRTWLTGAWRCTEWVHSVPHGLSLGVICIGILHMSSDECHARTWAAAWRRRRGELPQHCSPLGLQVAAAGLHAWIWERHKQRLFCCASALVFCC